MSTIHAPATDPGLLLGTWRNTNSSPPLIKDLAITEKAGAVWIRVFGANDLTPEDWGELAMSGFSESPESAVATAFTARFDSPATSVTLQTYVVKGVMVVVAMTRFKDGRHSNLFTKEFFHRRLEP